MTVLVISIAFLLSLSAICSLTEAALYTVGPSHVRHLAESGDLRGRLLEKFKQNMEMPISAILILNTVANTAGASVAGAQARHLFGESALLWFSLLITAAVLIFSEILPKVVGVAYARRVSAAVSIPLYGVIGILYPVIWVTQRLSRLVKPRKTVLSAPEAEVRQMALMSAEEGSILPREAELVENVLSLDEVTAREIMTPRPVVFKLPSNMTLREVSEKVKDWTQSRIPVYEADDPESWTGVVMSRDILAGLAQDQFDATLASLSKPIFFVSQDTLGHVLLKSFLTRRSHLFGVVDEYGGITGVVTLEDVMESLIGREIVDEADSAVDMQEVARIRHRKQFDEDNLSAEQEPS